MSIVKRGVKVIKKIVFGDTLLPQEFTVGLTEPQAEISVWLCGMGAPRDVTYRHTTACAAPLTICVAFDEGQLPKKKEYPNVSLKFVERGGQKRVLGKIHLKIKDIVSFDHSEFVLFQVSGSANYCLPRVRLWAHYLFQAYSQREKIKSSDVQMSAAEYRASMVTFIRPHPLALVSLGNQVSGNIFPMNLMGDLGNGYFAFALKDSRLAAHLVEDSGRIALSSVPLQQSSIPFKLAVNHTKRSIEWNELPFLTKLSSRFGIPVPAFATRVREMEVQKLYKIGSHTFFIARIISDERLAESPQICVIHGFYQAWRLKGQSARLRSSLAQDLLNKRGA
jgi:flavin reductase (DIM6/NTAB) family NADH-FMN oxidoreductase RutF